MAVNEIFTSLIKNNEIEQSSGHDDTKDTKEAVYLFVSFDICDSTILKQKNQDIWSDVINSFLEFIKIPNMEFWKFNGDELLFRSRIESVAEIIDIIDYVYRKIFGIQSSLQKLVPNLYIKSTIWLARVNIIPKSKTHSVPNYVIEYGYKTDYIGKNIDEGFRLTGHTTRQKLVVDPKIVYVLIKALKVLESDINSQTINDSFANSLLEKSSEEKEKYINDLNTVLEKMYLIGYKKSKGVWNGRDYPIILYIDKTKKSLDKSIHYDEYFNDKPVSEIINKLDIKRSKKENSVFDVKSIINQIGEEAELTKIINLLCYQKDIVSRDVKKTANLYYMVVCVDQKDKQVLVAKRSPKRTHLKNVWDFGNVKHNASNDLEQSIRFEYANQFGLSIDLLKDKDRKTLKPISFCTIFRNGEKHNGIMFFATINNDIPGNQTLEQYVNQHICNSDKYSKVRFLKLDDNFRLEELSFEEVEYDSRQAYIGKPQKDFSDKDYVIPNFEISIKQAISELCVV